MGSCSRRQFLLSICFLQLLFIIERQVFDFLGYMWAPILANFFHIIFVIFGFFGAYQYRPKYLVTYSLWNLLWIGWNAFLICFYLNAGILDRDSDLLNLGTGSVSWFEVNGYGCKPTYPMNITSEDPYRPVRPERVDGCLLDYHIVEIVQSSLQCALALLGFFGAVCLGHTYLDEDDSFDFMGGDAKSPQHTAVHPMYVSYTSLPTTNSATSTQLKQANAASAAAKSAQSAITNSTTVITANKHNTNRNSKKSKHRQSLYSIEFSRPVDAIRGAHDDDDLRGPSLSPKPMTPRRVKRRSVMQRGTTNRQSTTSRRSHSNTRNSARNSRRKIHQNPVTKLMNQQSAGTMTLTKTFPQFVHNKNSELTESNLKSLNNDYIISQSTASMLNNFSKMGPNNLNTFNHPPRHNTHTPTLPDGSPIDPIYYNMNSSSPLLQQQTSWASANPGGHSNPTYQHSTSNLNHSPELNDDYYTNNRPPSVRSSYSNFHGTRPLSSYATAGGNLNIAQPGGSTAENVFASLTNQQQQQMNTQQQQSQQQQQKQQQVLPIGDSLSVPQLPHRRSVSRESLRAMQFLNSGPPAYNLNYHTPPDSETTM
ncbi:sodium/potassium-transporting ATPase subunit beta-1-interacting protein isoform X2 [Wyeomyia smithii]|uniref:sodium/potassium-transporting ATPase subunit beta-1-interacting protein isoform X2 n=1 Tax=Wyeomyia smithii TaxID=174621 RepID=UPI002467EF75|nr:sodium/potassium-transporting ATPase subunit beta-1-interacting protein isoform X2 [Wyeomyia smithii]